MIGPDAAKLITIVHGRTYRRWLRQARNHTTKKRMGLPRTAAAIRDVAEYDAATGTTTIANHVVFDSFGRRTSETNAALADFDLGETGTWLDRATGLTWHRARWYNPDIQRWMSVDPIGFEAGDAHLYRYVGNMPTRYRDPSGLVRDEGWDWPSWDDYWAYLNPLSGNEELDTDIAVGMAVAGGVGVAAGGAAVVITVGPGAAATCVAKELGEAAFEEATGIPVILGPDDIIEGLGKRAAKRAARKEVRLGKFLGGDDVGEAGRHARDVGEVTGVVDRAGKDARRAQNLRCTPTARGLDRDEYPPAVILPDDPARTSVRLIDPSHNRRSGRRLRDELPPDGTRVRIVPPPE